MPEIKDTVHEIASETRKLLRPSETSQEPKGPAAPGRFFDGTKWLIPKHSFIAFKLPPEEIRKIDKWQDEGHALKIFTSPAGEVVILNETLLADLRMRDEAKKITKAAAKIEREAP
jgi:hypothetical protein